MKKQIARETSPLEDTQSASATVAAVLDPLAASEDGLQAVAPARRQRRLPATIPNKRFPAIQMDEHATNHQAELFYLQKQIQLQTQMVLILEDGSRVQGVVEWYDRNCIKVRGKARVLVYKSAIKYLYKAGEVGSAPE